MSTWKLRLFEKFELLDPQGRSVRFPTRKADAALAILVLRRRFGLTREELGEMLWPSAPEARRRDNLRQTLLFLRKALGEESLEATRTHCRLASTFRLTTDLEDESTRLGATLLPGFDGEWCELAREEYGTKQKSQPKGVTPIGNFIAILDWYVDREPERMLGLMRENLPLVLGMALEDHRRLLGRIKRPGNQSGWKDFWQANLVMAGGSVDMGGKLLRAVIEQAERERDPLLGVQASAQVCLSSVMQNKFEQARAAGALCQDWASRSRDARLMPTAIQIQGIASLHKGDLKEGLMMLERAEQMYRDPLDSAVMMALRAYYLSCHGLDSTAQQLLTLPSQLAAETGHKFLEALCSLTHSQISFHQSRLMDVVPEIQESIKLTRALANSHLEVPSRELLAQVFQRAGEKSLAKQEMNKARRIRLSMSMAYTPIDRLRLGLRPSL